MARWYVVIPEGTPVTLVGASTPDFAVSKAAKGKGKQVTSSNTQVIAMSRVLVPRDQVSKDQLSIFD